jgi:hypothetical protein
MSDGSSKTLAEHAASAVHVGVGLGALALDALKSIAQDPAGFADLLQRRGYVLDRYARRTLRSLRPGDGLDVKSLSDGALLPARWVQNEVMTTGHYAEDEVTRQVERLLERLGIPSRDRIEKLNLEIEALSARIDEELLALGAANKAPV